VSLNDSILFCNHVGSTNGSAYNRKDIGIMKIISYIIFILLVFSNLCLASGVRNVQENYQVIYSILDNDGTFVSGETVALKIKKISNGHWYDFSDDTFKVSGWTSKSANLSEDATEDYYYYTYDPPGTETVAEQYLFMVSNANATYKDHQGELVSYQDIGTSDFDYSSNNVTVGDFVSGVIDDDALGTITELPVSTDYSSTRAGYMDKLNVSGTLAHSDSASTYKADVSALATSVALATAQADLDNPNQYKATGFLTDKTGFSLSSAGIDAIWDEVITGHATADSFGKVFDNQIDGLRTYGDSNWLTATGFSTHSAADIWGVAVRTLTDKTGYSLSAAGIDSIWDEPQAGHITASTFGKYLDSEISGITTSISDADKNDIVDKTWDELLSGHTIVDSAGRGLSDAASAGDPWATVVPGSYTGSQAGFLFSYIDATISSRAQPSDVQIYVGE